MALQSYTEKSAAPAPQSESIFEGVEFPVPTHEWVLPSANLADVIRASELLFTTYNAIPGERERRKESGIDVEFTM